MKQFVIDHADNTQIAARLNYVPYYEVIGLLFYTTTEASSFPDLVVEGIKLTFARQSFCIIC
jgi:hypothetical protein